MMIIPAITRTVETFMLFTEYVTVGDISPPQVGRTYRNNLA